MEGRGRYCSSRIYAGEAYVTVHKDIGIGPDRIDKERERERKIEIEREKVEWSEEFLITCRSFSN